MSGIPRFHVLMRDLAHEVDAGRLTDVEAAGKVAQAIQKSLACMHVTFWSVAGAIGSREMRSIAAYDGSREMAIAGRARFPESGGGFFGELAQEGCFVCADTFADARLQGVKETMLRPYAIHALLAASYGGGDSWGFVTCTHTSVRTWRSSEVTALRQCAAEIAALRARRRTLGMVLSSGGLLA